MGLVGPRLHTASKGPCRCVGPYMALKGSCWAEILVGPRFLGSYKACERPCPDLILKWLQRTAGSPGRRPGGPGRGKSARGDPPPSCFKLF